MRIFFLFFWFKTTVFTYNSCNLYQLYSKGRIDCCICVKYRPHKTWMTLKNLFHWLLWVNIWCLTYPKGKTKNARKLEKIKIKNSTSRKTSTLKKSLKKYIYNALIMNHFAWWITSKSSDVIWVQAVSLTNEK